MRVCPRPSGAGTNTTPPLSGHDAAISCDSSDDAIRPRPSRSHCTFVPAASITASMPHVTRPARRHATIGKVPCGPRSVNAGGASPSVRSSMPPVPKVILASPGCTHPWPTSEACWSPSRHAIGGAPGKARASATTAAESTICGSIRAGMRNASRTRASHCSGWSTTWMPVTAAFVASVTCAVPSDSTHVIHVSTVPKQRSRVAVRVEGVEQPLQLGRGLVRREAEAFALVDEARADRAQVLPPEPGPDRLTGRAVPHDRRCALVRDPDRVDRAHGVERGA